jgi:hypothetical protein
MDTLSTYARTIEELKNNGIQSELIRTYSELEKVRDDFLIGHNGFKTPFLIVVSTPGLAKSYSFERVTGRGAYINSAASAFGLYRLAFENRGLPLILDDIDSLLTDKTALSVLKALCNDRKCKSVSWIKRIPASENLPTQFETESRVCMLFNSVPLKIVAARALFDRARFVIFAPTVKEVHRYVQSWFPEKHKQIYEFIGHRLHQIGIPSIRTYYKAYHQELLNNDWKFWIESLFEDGENKKFRIMGDILKNMPIGEEQEKAWASQTGLSRATFYRVKAVYTDHHDVLALRDNQAPVLQSQEIATSVVQQNS